MQFSWLLNIANITEFRQATYVCGILRIRNGDCFEEVLGLYVGKLIYIHICGTYYYLTLGLP